MWSNPVACFLETLSVDVDTGTVNNAPLYSSPVQWDGTPALDRMGAHLFAVSIDPGCTEPGLLTVFSVSTNGQVRPTGATAPAGLCPHAVVVTE